MRLRFCSLVALVAVACSSGSTGPHATSNIFFVAGNHQSDTILGKLPQALLIAVRIPRGQSAAGHVVHFTSIPDTNARLGNQIYFNPPGSQSSYFPQNYSAWDDTTNRAAQALVNITMGVQAGIVPVVIRVPDFGYVDTATFTVLPGGAVSVVASPSDTTVFTGASFTYNSHTVDRFGNPRPDTITYAVEEGPLTIAGAKATAGEPGEAIISMIASKPGVGTSGNVEVVPHGALAASNGTGIVTFQLDGTEMTTILEGTPAGYVKWDPTGTHLAFDGYAGCQAYNPFLSTIDLHGNVTVIGNGGGFQGTGNYFDAYPSYSPDGKWVYYQQTEQAGVVTGRVRRVHIDRTDDTLIAGPYAYYPSPSPDNNRIAYADASGPTTALRIWNLSTGTSDSIQSSVWSPEWSPTGNQIAYLTPFNGCTGQIALIAPDGSGNHILTSDTYREGFDWSPDGQWIVATNASTGLTDLISTTTGQTITLSYTQGLVSPAWQPGSSSSTNRLRNKLGHK